MSQFANVVLPLPLPQLFTYLVNPSEPVEIGMRVIVPFGRRKFYTAIIIEIHQTPPVHYDAKPIHTVLDEYPVINLLQLDFWKWMSDYYQCTLGDVFKAALPSGFKMASETHVFANPDFCETTPLTSNELTILGFVNSQKKTTISEIQKQLDKKEVFNTLFKLHHLGALSIEESIEESYKPKTVTGYYLGENFRTEETLKTVFDQLNRATKQLEILMLFISKVGFAKALEGKRILKSQLEEDAALSPAPLNELVKKQILVPYAHEIGRLNYEITQTIAPKALNDGQIKAMDEINTAFYNHQTVLLKGVTGSGKTEIYIHLIEQAIKEHKQVLYLLPEIALTTQITSRLKLHFGNRLGIYHSKYSDGERVEVWNDVLMKKNYQLILAVRSGIFLPFQNLGLIIVDEEHENSFKQYDPAPRYHARDSAIMLGHLHKANVLLASATPSVDSFYNAMQGKYTLVELNERYGGLEMPQILIANVREAKRKKQMKSHFTPLLIEQLTIALNAKEQVILFQNRRGFAPYVECGECAHIPKCQNCDVSMTYHKNKHLLNCHYCGYSLAFPNECPACGSPAMETRGFGTEKIEQELKLFFPEARIARMDLDTTRSKKAYETILFDFEQKKLDILVGTQMISKGLDFDNVSLVGILDAENTLNYPDFRSHERGFQLMSQVSGRAGRKHKQGTVVLQTTDPDHPVIQWVIQHNYHDFLKAQLEERELFKYPPFYRLIHITIKHRDEGRTDKASRNLALALGQIFGNRVLGPQPPLVARIQTLFIRQIMLKLERNASMIKTKQMIQHSIHALIAQPEYRSVIVQINVDPV